MFRAASAFVSAEQPTRQTDTYLRAEAWQRACDGYNVLMREKDTKGGRSNNEKKLRKPVLDLSDIDRGLRTFGTDNDRKCAVSAVT
jgi:hypothetical protein